jgi:hypothetical protein
LLILILLQILDDFVVVRDVVRLIIRKSDAFKIDLNTEDYYGKTGISYFKIQDQEELNAYAVKNNVDFETDLLNGFKLQCQTE